jgi:hypothetical protein
MLCRPLSNFETSPVLAESSVGPRLFLRYALKTDMPAIVGFYKEDLPPDRNEQAMLNGFQDMFSSFARSGKSQAFMVCLEEIPLFEVEVHDARLHFPYENAYTPEEKDYYMVLKAGAFDLAGFGEYVRGLRLCLNYFLGFPEVQEIIALVNGAPRMQEQASLFSQAGMEKRFRIAGPLQEDLYRIARTVLSQSSAAYTDSASTSGIS